ncbi:MAG: 16S rRNA (adenine(1518)-N(6)/adenine(1519)-N(6))-dimethyltransferase RsmA [Pyrinomonadaceae bacterium]
MSTFKIQDSRFKIQKPVYAKKSFGQNFLVDGNYIDKIIAALKPQIGETIIEIGAGRGALTAKLIESGANIIAIELERDMIAVLKENFGREEKFRLIESDALKIDFGELMNPKSKIQNPKSAKLVANLPYYLSTAILQKLIGQRDVFSEMILMFQREVVERITAQVGNSERGFLSVLVQMYLETQILFDVPPSAFRPSPKVNSGVVRLKPKDDSEIENESLFRELISAAFLQKRKTIFNNLKNAAPDLREKMGDLHQLLEKCCIEPSRRAETLTIEEWRCICNFL